MAMLRDLLKDLVPKIQTGMNVPTIERSPSELGLDSADNSVKDAQKFMDKRGAMSNVDASKLITNDSGDFSLDQTPFASLKDMLAKSRAGDNSGPGVLRQLLSSVLGGGLIPHTGTVGGGGPPDHVPGTRQDAALNPSPLDQQRQPNLASSIPTPQARPDYSQPTALDPVAIEQLRQSLLSDSGQLDPSNPNGLAGRMSSPNANVEQNNQRNEAISIEDSVRGFDGVRKAKIKQNTAGTNAASPTVNQSGDPTWQEFKVGVGSPRMVDKITGMRHAIDQQGVIDAVGFPNIYNKVQTTQGLLDAILSNSEALLPLHGLKDLLVKMGIGKPIEKRRAVETNQPVEDKV